MSIILLRNQIMTLNLSKERLWNYRDTKDFSRWDLSQYDKDNIDNLLQDEELAKIKMLPKETEKVVNKLNLLRYIENQWVKEIRR